MNGDPFVPELAPHGARWSAAHAKAVAAIAAPHLPPGSLVWDPFAGTGERFHGEIGPANGWRTLGSELEAEWALWSPMPADVEIAPDGWPTLDTLDRPGPYAFGNVVADSSTIPGRFVQSFAGVVTSPVFDNRFADRYLGANDYKTRVRCPACRGAERTPPCERCSGVGEIDRKPATKTFRTPNGPVVRPDRANYTAQLGRPLHSRNAGQYRGPEWQAITSLVLTAAVRATRPGGVLVVEMKDAIETKGTGPDKREVRVYAFDWLVGWITRGALPVRVIESHALDAAGYLNGANRDQRATYTQVTVIEVLG